MLTQCERSAGHDMGRLSPLRLRIPCTRGFDSLHRNRRELGGNERNKEWSAGSEIHLESELIGRPDTKLPRMTLARGDILSVFENPQFMRERRCRFGRHKPAPGV